MMGGLSSPDRVRRLVRWLLRRRLAVLLVAALVTAGAAWLAVGLRLESNLIALLPDDTPTIVALDQVVAKTSGAGDLMVMIESPDFAAARRYAAHLTTTLRGLDWVAQADYQRDTSFFEKHKVHYMKRADLEAIRDRLKRERQAAQRRAMVGDLGLGGDDEGDAGDEPAEESLDEVEARYREQAEVGRYFTDANRRVLLVVIYPKGLSNDLGFARRVFAEAETAVARSRPTGFHPEMKVTVGGTYRNRIDEFNVIARDASSGSVWVLLALLLFIAAYFRSLWAVPLLVLPVLISITWTFGLTYLVLGRLNIITVFLIFVLMGLGVDFGIHLLSRFQSERGRGLSAEDALVETLSTTGRAAVTAAMTNAVAFFVVGLGDFRGLSEFGLIAGSGMVLSSLSFVLVGPVLLAEVHRLGLMPPRSSALRMTGRPLPARGFILGACVLVTAAAALFAPRAAFEYDLRNIRSQVESRNEFNRKMRLVFPKARDPALLIAPDDATAAAVKQELDQRKARLGDRSLVEEVRTMADLLPRDLDVRLPLIADVRERLELALPDLEGKQAETARRFLADLQVPPPTDITVVPRELRLPFLGRDEVPGQLVYIFQGRSLMDLRNALAFSEEVGDIEVGGTRLQPASEPLVFADLWRVMKSDVPVSLAAMFAIMLLLLWLDVRSWKGLVLVLLPLVTGVLWMVGAMAMVPIKLNILNVTVIASVIGLGVDGGVHIYHRWKELGAARMTRILRDTGGAVFTATATSMIGFGGMLSAEHQGLRSLGQLALVGLGACLITALVFLPAVLASLRTQAPHSG